MLWDTTKCIAYNKRERVQTNIINQDQCQYIGKIFNIRAETIES